MIKIQEDDSSDYFERVTHSYAGSRGLSEVSILTNPYTKHVKFKVSFGRAAKTQEKLFHDYDAAIDFHSDFITKQL